MVGLVWFNYRWAADNPAETVAGTPSGQISVARPAGSADGMAGEGLLDLIQHVRREEAPPVG
jgi:hypothetical protein